MTIDDYEVIYQLWHSTPGIGLNTTDDSREGIAKYLGRNPTTCFVCENGGEIVGAIMSGHDGRRGYIHHTVVKESERGSGIGSRLVDAVLSALKNEGINKVALTAFSRNESGNAFWEKCGFTAREDLTYRNKEIVELEYL